MKKILTLILLIAAPAIIISQSIVTTKHNLSVGGPGTVKATSETEICLFCHTNHNSAPASPLWNRKSSGAQYTLYSSSTMRALPGQPSGSSILCLYCHDGTVALGSVLSRPQTISFSNTVAMPAGTSNLSTDLRNDHPISFLYDNELMKANGQLKDPTNLGSKVKLQNSQLQCTSCHDPHVNINSDFLVASTKNSNLCIICHNQTAWVTSSHNTSEKTWNHVVPNPWPYTPWTTVAENACENCHNPHNSGGMKRLLKYTAEEDNCLDCHNGNAASKNIQAEFAKTYKHDVYAYTGAHDPTEDATVTTKHVECVDCHNSHASTKAMDNTKAPAVRGPNAGVKGINQGGIAVNSVKYEYEICYRCHADNALTASTSTRQIVQNNQCHDQSATTNSHNAFSGSQTHGRLTSCNTCHDPHGVSASQGNIVNNSYLINFTNIVTKNSLGVLNYTKNSPGHGACNLSCHKHDHINSIY
ncbi:MAG: hypothetical protein NTX97_11885 [Bacteroidetes bacterium]|nr:hypothetical protein [Bacteroidota bacterium]